MTIPYRDSWRLRRTARAFRAADPHLVAMLDMFARLTAGEALPPTEQVRGFAARALAALAAIAAMAVRVVLGVARAAAALVRRLARGCAAACRSIRRRISHPSHPTSAPGRPPSQLA